MDRLEAMSVLLAVVEAGSLSAASRRLGMPLTTVSRKISDLEAHLHAGLLTRSSRSLALTDAGRSYVAACRRILEDVGEAERAAAGEYTAPKGDLVITAPIVFGRLHVLPIVTAFLAAYPEIDVRLFLDDRMVNLLEDHIDVALRIGELADSSMTAQKVGTIRRVVCASPGYLAVRGTPKAAKDLARHDCITFEGMTLPHEWTFRSGKGNEPVAIHSRLIVNTAEAAVDAAVAGVGIARVLSYQMAEQRRAGSLKVLLEKFEPPASPVSLVFGARGRLPLKTRAFVDFAVPLLKERIATYAA